MLSLGAEISALELKPYEAKYLASKLGIEITGTRKLEKIDTNKYKISMKTNFLWFKLYEAFCCSISLFGKLFFSFF